MSHEPHPKFSNLTCAYCHNRTGHPGLQGYSERIAMPLCVNCHQKEHVSTACRTCHPASFNLKPTSHTQGNWLQVHGKADLATRSRCHADKAGFCDACHGFAIRHPVNWRTAHAKQASFTVCTKRHTSQAFCQNCHQIVNPHPADWIAIHPRTVALQGASRCQVCHAVSFCSDCHRTP